jgi:hypothetical protein
MCFLQDMHKTCKVIPCLSFHPHLSLELLNGSLKFESAITVIVQINFGTYKSSIIPTLHDAQLRFYECFQKWLTVLKIGT